MSILLHVLAVIALVGLAEWLVCRIVARNAPLMDGDAALPPEARP